MWFLQNTATARIRLSLPAGRGLVIGRKDCDVLITGDNSISRRHAILHVTSNQRDSKVTLTDCKSKFGSAVGGKKLSANQKVDVNVNSELRFGQGQMGTFRLVYEPLVFCCSSMASDAKQRVKQLAKSLGGRVVNSWTSQCTHLVMSQLNVTIKVVSALSSCRPIVTPAWLEDASKCFTEGKALPSAEGYLPEVVDSNIDSGQGLFQPDFQRRLLFQDRTLYFLYQQQYSMLHHCVESAGARCSDCSQPGSVDLERLTAKESVVVGLDEDTIGKLEAGHRKWVEQVYNFLEGQELRIVNESEIGFALLYVSIENYCNPKSREGVEEAVAVTLPPPSLSQMPATQYTASQVPPLHSQPHPHHPPPSTPSLPSADPSILAPDSQPASQNSAQSAPKHLATSAATENTTSSAGSVVVVKINETVCHRGGKSTRENDTSERNEPSTDSQPGAPAKKRLKLSTKSTTTANASSECQHIKQPDLECLFDNDLSPIEVKTKTHVGSKSVGGSCGGPATSTQVQPGGGNRRKKSEDACKNETSLPDVGDPQPSMPTEGNEGDLLHASKLPGLPTVSESRSRLPVIGAKEQSQTSSLRLAESQEGGGSILVPSSLTPRLDENRSSKSGDGNSQLPSSGLISDIFQSKRKKRGAGESVVCIEDEEEKEERPAAKKQKKTAEVATSIEHVPDKPSVKETSGGLFAGLQSSRQKVRMEAGGGDKPKILEKSPPTNNNGYHKASMEIGEVNKTPKPNGVSTGNHGPSRDTGSATTPVKSSPSMSDSLFSPFLSTRKRKRQATQGDENCLSPEKPSTDESAPNSASASVRSLFPDTQGPAAVATTTVPAARTSAVSREVKKFDSPFTSLYSAVARFASEGGAPVVLGRRTKSTNSTIVMTAADALWEERDGGGGVDGFDGENPLGTQANDDGNSQIGVYKPVCTGDGFIEARKAPTLQMSRLGRLALRTRRELLSSPGSEGHELSEDLGGGEGGEATSSQPDVRVEIVRVNLVVRKIGRGRRERGGEETSEVTGNGLKNFKKFRKTMNTSIGAGIPRFVSLKEYVPDEDVTLQDWIVREETRRAENVATETHSEEEDTDDDVDNVFKQFAMSPIRRP